ncbi:MAG TPA: hypothetical protein VNT26_08400 [Candidatus Sulfotelmatobacter sp.]|nr:hypothetical protein [Candidatus Sulfotelmatobacter sp.]HWI56215.1 hypothetical protein [Bacillota bacterium]
MRFDIQPEAFIKLIAMLGESRLRHRHSKEIISLVAYQGIVSVESGARAAEIEAVVWEEGQCAVSRQQLLAALKANVEQSPLTVAAGERLLQVGTRFIPMVSFCRYAPTPQRFQIYFATDLGMVPSPVKPTGELVEVT